MPGFYPRIGTWGARVGGGSQDSWVLPQLWEGRGVGSGGIEQGDWEPGHMAFISPWELGD